MEDTGRRFESSKLEAFCAAVLEKVAVPRNNAEIVARSLLTANLRGIDTHGVTRLPIYVERLRAGLIDGRAAGEVVSESETTAAIDGQNGLGQVVGTRGMQLAVRKASSAGVGLVTVRNSNHYGTAGYYAMMALDHDLIGLSVTNSPPLMPPWGGQRPFFGTNPLALAVPAGEENPFVFDAATSVVARGAIVLAAKKGEQIPSTWATDRNGEPTSDPNAALAGALLPMGGHKGYGLAMFIDILSAVLAGGPFGPHVGELYNNPTTPQVLGHFFAAIRVDRFRPIREFKAEMDAMIRDVKAQPLGKGSERIMVAGEPEALTEADRRKHGIPLSPAVVDELAQLGSSVGVSLVA